MKQKGKVTKLVVYMLTALLVTIPFSGCVIEQGNAPKLSVSVNGTGTATITVSLSGLDRDNIDPETNPNWNLYSVYCLYAVSAAEKTALSAISPKAPLWDTKQTEPVTSYISKYADRVIRYDVPKTEVEAFRATNGSRPTSWSKTFTGQLSADANGVSTDYIVLLYGKDCVGNGVQYADGYYSSDKVTLTSSFTGGSTGGNTGDHTHTIKTYTGSSATCTQAGSKGYYYCTTCGKYYEDAKATKEITSSIDTWKVIPAKGHSMTKHAKQAATCTKDGSKEYYSCSACGNNYADAAGKTAISGDVATWAKIAATGHTGGEATCSAKAKCSVCGAQYGDLNPAKHTPKKVAAVQATCTSAGSKEYYKCSGCSKCFENAACTKEITNIDSWKVVAATGHAFDTAWSYDKTNHWHSATCAHTSEKKDTAAHSFNANNICTTCGYQKNAHVHAGVKVAAVQATCTTAGSKEYYKCSGCGKYFENAACTKEITNIDSWKVVPATGHAFDTAWSYDEANHWHSATCAHTSEKKDTAAHSFNASNVCTTCGYQKNAHVHAGVKVDAVQATCTSAGSRAYYKCSGCGKYFENAACTKEITNIDTWKVVAATGHSTEMVEAVEATCTSAGSKGYYICHICGKCYEDAACMTEIDDVDSWKVVAATGHTFDTKWTYDETNHWHSAICAHTSEKQDTAAHTFDANNVCTTCGYQKAPAHTHAGTKVDGKPATCTTDGAKEYYTCACGKYYEDAACTKEITESLDTWKVIAATGHKEAEVAAVPATQTADGKRAGKKCSVCGEIISGCEVIYRAKTVELAQKSFVYDGKAKTPKLNVKDSRGNIIAASYYTVKFAAGRKDVGKYKAELTFKGSYSGSKSLTFTIVPGGTGVGKVSADKKSLKITLKKQTKQTTGYEVQVSTDKNFRKNIKKATLKNPKKNTVTIKKLKSGTKYYIRVRTYKTVKGKKYYSDWKKYRKAVTTKK